MATNALSTVRVKRFRERRSRGVALIAPVKVGEGSVALLVSNGLLKEHETLDRKAVGEACLTRPWSSGPWAVAHGPRDRVSPLKRWPREMIERLTSRMVNTNSDKR